mgnify:FL=1
MTSKVVAIGSDLHLLGRFKNILRRNGPLTEFKTKRLCQRILNEKHELPLFQKYMRKNDIDSCSNVMAGAWCVKEAIYKCLDSQDQKTFRMAQWWKSHDVNGKPIIKNENYFKTDKGKAEEFFCTISHDGNYIFSIVLRQKNDIKH